MKWFLKRKSEPVPPFDHVTIPVVLNQGRAIRTDEMFNGPSLATPVSGIFEWKYVKRGRVRRLWNRIVFYWRRMRGQIKDDCWWSR